MSLTITFYSYKGGVGRSILAANLAVLLARHGKTLLCDFDLEAPGLHRIDDLSSASSNRAGLFEWLHDWEHKRKFDTPTARDLAKLGKSILSCQKQHNLYLLPAHGQNADAAALYQGINWAHFLANQPEIGLQMLRTLLTHLREKEGYRYILLDSRTGITDIGGFLTAWLPDVTVLVGNYGAQNTGGLSQVWQALKHHAEDSQRGENGQFQPLRLELVASPVPSDNSELQTRLRSQWEKDFGLAADSLIEIPERTDLRRSEALLTLSETDSPIVRRYHELAARLLALETANERANRDADLAQRQRPEHFLNLEKAGNRARQGKTFEERIADLLRLLGYRVEPEQTLDGNRIDLIASIQQGLDTSSYFVECKDHQKAVGKEIVETLDVWLRTPQARERAARGMIVARRFSPQALELARARNIRCFTPEDLERALIDFSTYLNRLIADFANSPLANSYIEQQVEAEKAPETTQPLLPYALAWSRGEGSRLWVLLGDYGTGKTAFTRRFAYELAQKSLGNGDNPIPLLINLRDFPNKATLGDLLHEHWHRQTGERLDPAIFLHLLARGRLLLIDSFDEMGVAQAHRNVVEQFRMLAQPSDSQGDGPRANRILITCREQFFREHGEAQQAVQGGNDRLALLEQAARSFDGNIDVLPRFNENQIQAYLNRRLGSRAGKQAWRDIASIYNLPSLADRPQLLDIIIDSLPDLKKSGETVTAGALYLRYTNRWLDDYHHIDRQSSSADLLLILEALAIELWRREGQRIHHGDLYALIKDRRLPGKLDPGILDLELRTAAFLSRTSDGYYGFSHRSFLEFFYARALLAAATPPATQATAATPLASNLATTLAARLAGPLPSREAAGFFADLLALHDPATQAQVRQTVATILTAQPAAPARSATTLLTGPTPHSTSSRRNAYLLGYWASQQANGGKQNNWLPAPPQRLDLTDCHFQDLTLPGAQLGNAELAGSDWSRSRLDQADLRGAHAEGACFSRSSLRQSLLNDAVLDRINADDADLEGADLSRVSAQHSRWINARLQHAILDAADFSAADLRAARLAHSQGEGRFTDAQLSGCTAPGTGMAALPQLPSRPLKPSLGLGHTSVVAHAAFSPDGTRIVSAGHDGTLRLWDTASGREICHLTGHTNAVVSTAFSPDGTHIVSASIDQTLRLWDAGTGQEIRRFTGHSASVFSAAFSPDSTCIISASEDHTLRLWNVESGREVRRYTGHTAEVASAAFSPDGTQIISASLDQTLRLWDVQTGQEIRRFSGHPDAFVSAAFSPDGSHIVSAASNTPTLRLWDIQSGQEIRRFTGHQAGVLGVVFSPDGTQIISAGFDHSLRLWDFQSGNEIHRYTGHSGWVNSAALSPDGACLVSTSRDQTVRLWDTESGQEIRLFPVQPHGFISAAFSPDGNNIVSASGTHPLRLWNAQSWQAVRQFTGHSDWVHCAAFSSDGTCVVSASDDQTIRVWNTQTGQEIRQLNGHSGWILSAIFSHDDTRIVSTGNNETLSLWDAESGQEIRRFTGHSSPVLSAAFSPDDSRIVSASSDQTLRLWDTQSGQEIRQFTGHSHWVWSAAFSPDGTRIVSASSDQTLRLWDTQTGQEIRCLKGHGDGVRSAVFSRDGNRILSASDDQTLRLWDAQTGEEIRRFIGHSAGVCSAAFSPDCNRILSASFDQTLRLWDTESGQALCCLWEDGDAWFALDLRGFDPAARLDALPGPILRGQGPTPLVFIDPEEKLQPAPWLPRHWHADDLPALWFPQEG